MPASILQEGQEEGLEHLRALVVGSEDVEQPPTPLAAVPVGTARAHPLSRVTTVAPITLGSSIALCKDEVPQGYKCPSAILCSPTWV